MGLFLSNRYYLELVQWADRLFIRFNHSMVKPRKPPKILRAVFALEKDESARPLPVKGGGLDPDLARLRLWQSERLRRTYADLLASPEYAPACSFFLSDIYSARDFSERDAHGEQLYALLRRYLPIEMLRPLTEALELNRLTNELDARLLEAFRDSGAIEEITEETYAAAYRQCDNFSERMEQIERIGAILREVGAGARLPLVGLTLKLVRLPARRAGWSELYEFLARGYEAFQPMNDVDYFVDTIVRREKLILERIYASHPQPFSLQEGE